MKILITTNCYTPAVNGVVTSVLNLRKELQLRGHEVRVLTLSQTTQSFSQDGVTYIGSIGAGKVYPGARVKSALASSFIQELIEWEPDVVHSQLLLLFDRLRSMRNLLYVKVRAAVVKF